MHRLRVVLASALVVVSGLAGCLAEPAPEAAADLAPASARPTAGWQEGNWWSYRATFLDEGVTLDLALIVFDEAPDRFLVGSNLSAGFFGLPFNGTVLRPGLAPVVAGEPWHLYQFPLADGKAWEYPLFGHSVRSEATRATVEAPRVGAHAGFALEATSYGCLVAAYDWSPVAESFTRLRIFEPTDGRELVRVELTDFGESWTDDYFVEVPVRTVVAEYPRVGIPERILVPEGALRLQATAVLRGDAGDFRFTLEDPSGRAAMTGELRPSGLLLDREEVHGRAGAWTLDHRGLGVGHLRFEVTAVKAARAGAIVAAGDESADLVRALAVRAPEITLYDDRTTPAFPQRGHTTVAAEPLAGLA